MTLLYARLIALVVMSLSPCCTLLDSVSSSRCGGGKGGCRQWGGGREDEKGNGESESLGWRWLGKGDLPLPQLQAAGGFLSLLCAC